MNIIETVITNKEAVDRFIRWASKNPIWIGKTNTIVVPYDVWSSADRKQKDCIIAELQQNKVELELRVMTKDGVVSIDYDPSILYTKKDSTTIKKAKEAVKEKASVSTVNNSIKEFTEDDTSHNIKASSKESDDNAIYYGAKKEATDAKPVDNEPIKEGIPVKSNEDTYADMIERKAYTEAVDFLKEVFNKKTDKRITISTVKKYTTFAEVEAYLLGK